VGVRLQSFLTFPLDEVVNLTPWPLYPPRKNSGAHWIWAWMDPRASQGFWKREKNFWRCQYSNLGHFRLYPSHYKHQAMASLTLILLMWRIWWANNASKWQMGFNSAFKGLKVIVLQNIIKNVTEHKYVSSDTQLTTDDIMRFAPSLDNSW
jgi:hypothetical protein